MPNEHPTTATGTPTRRTQAGRSAETRAALADAAADLLVERGWAAVSAIDVCNRAGVSRGAFHHHYPSLPALLADALQRLYDEMAHTTQTPPADLIELVNATWTAISTPRFKAVLEAWLAMANDPDLRHDIGPIVSAFSTLVQPTLPDGRALNADEQARYLLAREAMLGLALGRATNGGRPLRHEEAVLTALRDNICNPRTPPTRKTASRRGHPRTAQAHKPTTRS